VPLINFFPKDPSTERFQAKYRDLIRAIFANDHFSAELCLREYPLFSQTYNINGESLGHIVCRAINADQEMASIVCDKNIYLDNAGNTALNLAAMFNRYDLVEFFSNFQNPNFPNHLGQTAFDFAFINNNQDIVNLLVLRTTNLFLDSAQDYQQDFQNKNSATKRALIGDLQVDSDLAVAQITEQKTLTQDLEHRKEKDSTDIQPEASLLQNNTKSVNNEIPINRVEEKSQQVVEFSKANPDIKESCEKELRLIQREAKLMLAEDKLSKEQEEESLLQKTIEENARELKSSAELKKIFLSAIENNSIPILEKILNNSLAQEFLNLELRNDNGETPLILACRLKAFEAADLLIARGAKVKVFEKNLRSPLHYCAQYSGENSFKTFNTIFEKSGRDSNFLKAEDSNRISAAMNCCREDGNSLIFRTILETGIYEEMTAKSQFLAMAFLKKNNKVIKVLLEKYPELKASYAQLLKKEKDDLSKSPDINSTISQTSKATSNASAEPVLKNLQAKKSK